MNAWTGTILRVNLTSGKITREPLNVQEARKFIGARGLAAKMLFDEVDPTIDALSPENKLFFAPGTHEGSFGKNVALPSRPACQGRPGAFGDVDQPALDLDGADLACPEGFGDAVWHLVGNLAVAGEDVHGGVAVLRPGVNGDVRLGDGHYHGDALRLEDVLRRPQDLGFQDVGNREGGIPNQPKVVERLSTTPVEIDQQMAS